VITIRRFTRKSLWWIWTRLGSVRWSVLGFALRLDKLLMGGRFLDVPLTHALCEVSLALITRRVDTADFRPSGSAVIIAPHLAITAKHVIEDHWRTFTGYDLPTNGHQHGVFHLQALQIIHGTQSGALWDVTELSCSGHTDVAFLYLSPGSETAHRYTRWRAPKLNFLAPAVGAEITAFGYRSSAIESVVGTTVTWRHAPTLSDGRVLEIHEDKREDVNLTFPCFRTNARFDGGMSGGPVFDSGGVLRGLVCYSSTSPDDPVHDTYAVLLWPSLVTPLRFRLDGTIVAPRYPAIELVRDGSIHALEADRIIVGDADATGSRRVGFRYP